MELTSEMRRLCGIDRRRDGGLLVQKPRSLAEDVNSPRVPLNNFVRPDSREQMLHEARSQRLYSSLNDMTKAMERATKGVQRVMASINHHRQSTMGHQVNETAMLEQYRLDQELCAAIEAMKCAQEALASFRSPTLERSAPKPAPAKRQGRRR